MKEDRDIQIYLHEKLLKFKNFDEMYEYIEERYDVYNCHISNYEEYIRIINDKIYESQLISSPIDKVISIINKKYNINLKKEKNNTISFKKTNKNFDTIINSLKTLGWNFSCAVIDDGVGFPKPNKNFDEVSNINDKEIVVFISSLNDIELSNIPDELYHITLDCFDDKIKKQGLKPSSKNKINIHDDRVYMFIECDYDILTNFSKRIFDGLDDDFIVKRFDDKVIFNVYKIDLNKTDKRNIRLFYDPYYKNNVAVYSKNGIPPICIEKIDKIIFDI